MKRRRNAPAVATAIVPIPDGPFPADYEIRLWPRGDDERLLVEAVRVDGAVARRAEDDDAGDVAWFSVSSSKEMAITAAARNASETAEARRRRLASRHVAPKTTASHSAITGQSMSPGMPGAHMAQSTLVTSEPTDTIGTLHRRAR